MSRRRQREEAMMLAYEMEVHKEEELAYLTSYFEKHEKDIQENEYSYAVLKNMLVNVAPIVKAIELGSAKWKLERISKLDFAILKIAVAELLFVDDVPAKVSINEAVELTKRYSGEQSFRYVNGVLRNINDNIENCAEKETSFIDTLMKAVAEDVKEAEEEAARLAEIALIEKRLAEIRAAKEDAIKQAVIDKEDAEKAVLEAGEDDDIVFLNMND